MRADRLLSLLMLLQTRGRMTAQALAAELEVSERTIYRDLEALSIAGVPVYAERGPGGGCRLLDSYRTSLTGLNGEEVQALFMLSIPAPLASLGVSQSLKAALLKLTTALPAVSQQAYVRQRIYLDWSEGRQDQPASPLLPVLHQAVWQNRWLEIEFHLPFGAVIHQRVQPLGLVAQSDSWHLVYRFEGRIRVQPIDRLTQGNLSGETFERPPDFDLERFWKVHCKEVEQSQSQFVVRVRLSPVAIQYLPFYLGDRVRPLLTGNRLLDSDGWTTLDLSFDSLETARSRLLSLGSGAEVLEPLSLRLSIIDYAEQIVRLYHPTKSG